jgi:hypothetical protein
MLAGLGATGDIRGRVQARDVVRNGRAWRALAAGPGLQADPDSGQAVLT